MGLSELCVQLCMVGICAYIVWMSVGMGWGGGGGGVPVGNFQADPGPIF